MALQYTILFALAFVAVAVAGAETPTAKNCTDEQETTIKNEWTNILSCFGQVLNNSTQEPLNCTHVKDIFQRRAQFITALACKTANDKKKIESVETNLDVVLQMMNTTVTQYRDLVMSGTFTECIDNKTESLRDCVQKNVHKENDEVAKDLGNFGVNKIILNLDFVNNSAKGKLKDINSCVEKVWESSEACKAAQNFTQSVFQIADDKAAPEPVIVKASPVQSAASIPISSFVIMIGASLFALYS